MNAQYVQYQFYIKFENIQNQSDLPRPSSGKVNGVTEFVYIFPFNWYCTEQTLAKVPQNTHIFNCKYQPLLKYFRKNDQTQTKVCLPTIVLPTKPTSSLWWYKNASDKDYIYCLSLLAKLLQDCLMLGLSTGANTLVQLCSIWTIKSVESVVLW